jgi:NTP pyrophosphatase (non-canonical NTP hydrolase)
VYNEYGEPGEELIAHWNEHNDYANDGPDDADDELDTVLASLHTKQLTAVTSMLGDLSDRCPARDLFAHVADITAWLDASNPAGPHEDAMRVLKLTEEAGEAAAAYIGMVGQNPRKGATHSLDDLLGELADVALTALCAIQHFTQSETATRALVDLRAAYVASRAGRRP